MQYRGMFFVLWYLSIPDFFSSPFALQRRRPASNSDSAIIHGKLQDLLEINHFKKFTACALSCASSLKKFKKL